MSFTENLLAVSLLAFQLATDNPGGSPIPPPALDIPEPATWQMLAIAGGAALGLRAWKRSRR
jgi:hypothetical protein